MNTGTADIKVNITRRFDGQCKVYAFDVKVDGDVYREVSREKAWKLVMQAMEVAEDGDWTIDVYGMDYLRAAR
ncbi:hypothetical protein [Shinella sp. DD12]|uniref:hypothetical protein n=1 Tax=Shinella sp. DD12 TaxID=1410620 RepID=UPI00043792F9|nr:hypothetical protein [Shinella sp. DD12]EYR81857.1 hypothetical protein SHLA_4c001490 [Shinella sp. DD12]